MKLTFKGLQPETIEDGPGPQPRHRLDGQPLRERDPVRRGRRARHQDLPRPAADRRPRRAAPRPEPVTAVILDHFRLDGQGRRRHRRRPGDRPRHRDRAGRGRRRRRRRRPHPGGPRRGGRPDRGDRPARRSRSSPTCWWPRTAQRLVDAAVERSAGSTSWSTTPAAPARGRRCRPRRRFFEMAMRFNVTAAVPDEPARRAGDGRHRRRRARSSTSPRARPTW